MYVYISREKGYLVIEKGKLTLKFLNYEIIDNFFQLQRYSTRRFFLKLSALVISSCS
jgi:hypothetical protein